MASGCSSESSTSLGQSFTVVVNKELVSLIGTAKKIDLVTTYAEVLDGLKIYIMKKKLFDPLDPTKICCSDDDLRLVLGVNDFSIYDVKKLLQRLVLPIRYIRNNSAETRPATSTSVNDNSLKRKCEESEDVRIMKKSCEQILNEPMILYIPPSPDRNTFESDTSDSIQGYETAFVKDTSDTSDGLSFFEDSDNSLVPGDIVAVEETYALEYEVESDTDQEEKISITESGSDSEGAVDTVISFVCKSDSDQEFWADKSSDEEFDSDLEIPDSDKWKCKRCGSFNNPPMRYCIKCWYMRTGWVVPKREERRVPSRRKLRSRRNKKLKRSSDRESSSSPKPQTSSSSNSAPESSGMSTSSNISFQNLPKTSNSIDKLIEDDISKSSQNLPTLVASTSKISEQLPKNSSSLDMLPDITYDISSSFQDLSTGSTDLPRSLPKTSSSSLDKLPDIFYDISSSSQDLSTLSSYSSSQEFPSTSSCGSSQDFLTSRISSQECPSTSKSICIGTADRRTPNLSTVPKCESDSKLCLLCCSKPANASIIHGKYAHQISCYRCARKLQHENKRCPVCRRTIDRVVYQISAI